MKVSLLKNKVLLINTILLWVSFIVLIYLILIVNYIFDEAKISFVDLFTEYSLFSKVKISPIELLIAIPFNVFWILLIVHLVNLFWRTILIFKKEGKIDIRFLLFIDIIFLILIICFVIVHAFLPIINAILGYILFIPIIIFAIYNLVSTIVLYMRGTKTIKTNA